MPSYLTGPGRICQMRPGYRLPRFGRRRLLLQWTQAIGRSFGASPDERTQLHAKSSDGSQSPRSQSSHDKESLDLRRLGHVRVPNSSIEGSIARNGLPKWPSDEGSAQVWNSLISPSVAPMPRITDLFLKSEVRVLSGPSWPGTHQVSPLSELSAG
jgi:hypothetical protein